MTFRVILQPRAEEDVEGAYLFFAGQSRDRADRWLGGLRKSFASLQTLPERCPLARERAAFGVEVRQLLHGKGRNRYRILFTVTDDTFRILAVRHGARGPLWIRDAARSIHVTPSFPATARMTSRGGLI